MATVWMRGKLAKIKAERMAAPMLMPDIKPSNLDMGAMVEQFISNGGVVHREPCTGKQPYLSYGVMGKGRRTRDKRTHGNGARKGLCAVGALNVRQV